MNIFQPEDIVAFADGKPRTLRIWDTDMKIDFLQVIGTDGNTVKTVHFDTYFDFPAGELIKVGELHDTEIRADDKEYFKWILNDEDL